MLYLLESLPSLVEENYSEYIVSAEAKVATSLRCGKGNYSS